MELDLEDWLDLIFSNVSPDVEQMIVVAFWATVAVATPIGLFYVSGRRQRIEFGGTTRRLLFVSLVATGFSILPLGVCVAAWFLGLTTNESVPGLGFLLSVFAGALAASLLRIPDRIRGHDEQLQSVSDTAFLARLGELSRRMHLRRPAIRLLKSTTPDQQATAYVTGLVAPVILVTDGLLVRLDADERDAIVCHELAHLANGTLWYLMAVGSLAAVGGAVALICGVTTWFLFVPALVVGLNRLFLRPLELDCDLRAARAMGFAEMGVALQKIHRLGIDGQTSPRLRELIHATGTHPPLAARLDYLRRHASAGDLDRIPMPAPPERLLAWAMGGVYVASVSVAWFLGRNTSVWAIAASALLLLSVTFAPLFLLLFSVRKTPHSPKRSARLKSLGIILVLVALLLTPLLWTNYLRRISDDEQMFALVGVVTSVMILAVVAGLVYLMIWLQPHQLKSDLLTAWMGHDFERVLELARKAPRRIARDPGMRQMVAWSRAVIGDAAGATAQLESLIADYPGDIDCYLVLANLQFEEGNMQAVLELAETISSRFPKQGIGAAIASRVFRRLNRLDEAWDKIECAMALNPEMGAICAAAAGVAADRGDIARARELLVKAGELTPGTPQELAEDAHLSVRTEAAPVAIPKLKRAIAAFEANPLLLRKSELKSLRQELATLSSDKPVAEWVTEIVEG